MKKSNEQEKATESELPVKICPSILAGDFGHLADEARRIEETGAEWLHLDVMDGQFVPNITFGPQAVAAINRATPMPLDVHLMMYNPYDFVERFVEAGADMITFHFEATENVEETLNYIRSCGIKAGLAFSPETSMSMIPKYLYRCDKILLMTVHPGFGGQKFIPEVLDKVRFARDLCNQLNIRAGGISPKKGSKKSLAPFDIQVDGGINLENVRECAKAGANLIVAGSSLFQHEDLKEAVSVMRKTANN